jgi:hypothetical protein
MKRLASALTVALLLVVSSPSVYAASKIGSSCKRQGVTLKYKGEILVCTRVGNSLKYQIPKSDSSRGSSNPIQEGVNKVVVQAFNAFDHAACKGKHPNFSVSYLKSPSYSTEMLTQQKSLFEQAMSCYNNYFDQNVRINIALVNENDYEFLLGQKNQGVPVFDEIQLRWAKFMMSRISSGAGRFAGSAGWNVTSNSAWVLMIDSSLSTAPDSHGAAHEFVHILQSYSKSPLFPYYGDGSTAADYVNMPTWFWEGTGELFSYETISKDSLEFSRNMHEVRNQGQGSPSLNKISTEAQVVSTLKILESPEGQEANMMCYALGSVMSEYILANYGYAKYWKVMKNASTFRDFNENVQNALGLSLNDLYAKAAPFILSQWKENSFN